MPEPYISVEDFLLEPSVRWQEFQATDGDGNPLATETEDAVKDRISKALLWASQLIDQWTNRDKYGMWFAPRDMIVHVDGRGHNLLQLPYPLLELGALFLLDKVNATEEELTNVIDVKKLALARNDGYDFDEGYNNIRIQGQWGDCHTPPEPIRRATTLLALRRLRGEQIVAGERVTILGPFGTYKAGTLTGSAEVDATLESYRFKGRHFLEG